MKVYDAAAIRNVALVGHSGSGKTQLASAILFDTGAINRFGTVDDGTTVTDHDEEEIARKHTLSAGFAAAEWNKHKLNLIDTPGMSNFLSDARAALRVVECALVVVDAVSGVEVSTEKIWAAADELAVPRLIVLNRLDRDRASVERALDSVHASFGRGAVPIQLPIGEEKDFKGIVDLVSMKSYTSDPDGNGKVTESGVPGALVDAAKAARERLIEMVAEADDALMEKFFEAGTLTQDELLEGLHRGVRGGTIYPVVCASGLKNIGIQPLLDAIVHYVPAPTEHPMRGVKPGTEEVVEKEAAPNGPAVAYVWKTIADQFAGRITLFRVITGTLTSDSNAHNVTRDTQERLGHLLLVQGKTHTHVAEIHAGDIGAVAKLKDTQTGDTIGDKNGGFVMRPMEFPEPVISYAMEPKTRGDEDKISTSMHRLQEEDPSIGYSRDPQTHELLLSGQGQLHIEVTVAKLKKRFGVEVHLKLPRIPYRETITASTEAHGRHKKQTGGHGQFGDCRIRMAPLPRGGDFVFEDDIFGGAIPRGFVPAIEKGIQETRMRGYLAGYPVVDFKVTVYDGSYHDVDSNEMSFKMAGRLAFKDAMTRCRPTILEPVMLVEVVAPSDFAGDLMGDLNGRRGRISGMDTRGSSTVIKAQVPMAEMLSYEQQLTSMTGGRGGYHMEFSHYDEVPSHLQTKIIEKAKAERAGVSEEEA
ncbi:MAG: elongation factor G [Acidobacteriota bacterium]|nr:elongation factor G [Acidobacteriota bacterium]